MKAKPSPVQAVKANLSRLQLTLGVLAILVLPLVSTLDGSRLFAWSMFSGSGTYRIGVTAWTREGRARIINPTELAPLSTPNSAIYLAGSDHWRRGPSLALLRARLPDLADLVCRHYAAKAVEVTLRERSRGTEESSAATLQCPD